MKNLFSIIFILTITTLSAQDFSVATFSEKWENSKSYLLQIAQSMPEEKYDYMPTEREMSFKEQLLHELAGQNLF